MLTLTSYLGVTADGNQGQQQGGYVRFLTRPLSGAASSLCLMLTLSSFIQPQQGGYQQGGYGGAPQQGGYYPPQQGGYGAPPPQQYGQQRAYPVLFKSGVVSEREAQSSMMILADP